MAVRFATARGRETRKTGVSVSSYSENDDQRAEIALLAVQYAEGKPQFLDAEIAAIVLGGLWGEAAYRSGIPSVSIFRPDGNDGDEACDPRVLLALRRRDLPALLREAHELGTAGQWRNLWTVLRDAFGVRGIGR